MKDLPLKLIKAILKCNHGITGKLADRYATLLQVRFVLWSIDKIDIPMVNEDLYQEDEKGNELESISLRKPFCNLDYDETEMKKIYKKEIYYCNTK